LNFCVNALTSCFLYKKTGGPNSTRVVLTQASENIQYFFSSPLENRDLLLDLYINKGLSASQIGGKYSHSKSFVLGLLSKFRIEKRPPHQNGTKTSTPPFGSKHYRQRLAQEGSEQLVIDKILKMSSQKMSLRAIANALDTEGIPARQGTKWNPQKIKRILDRQKSNGNNTGKRCS